MTEAEERVALLARAAKHAAENGHVLTDFVRDSRRYRARCEACGQGVVVDPKGPPPGYGGQAVKYECGPVPHEGERATNDTATAVATNDGEASPAKDDTQEVPMSTETGAAPEATPQEPAQPVTKKASRKRAAKAPAGEKAARPAKTKKATKAKRTRAVVLAFEKYPVHAVIRWLGKQGFDVESARKAFAAIGVEPKRIAPTVLERLLWPSRRAEGFEVAKLTNEEAAKLLPFKPPIPTIRGNRTKAQVKLVEKAREAKAAEKAPKKAKKAKATKRAKKAAAPTETTTETPAATPAEETPAAQAV